MKKQHLLIIFVGLLFIFVMLLAVISRKTTNSSIRNKQYSDILAGSVHDAAKTIKTENYRMNRGVWRTQDDIDATISALYTNIASNLNLNPGAELNIERVKQRIPIIMLIDVEGFYITYNALYDQYGNSDLPVSYADYSSTVTSGLNTWTETLSSSSIRYFLTDYIEVLASNKELYTGRREDVISQLVEDGVFSSELNFLADDIVFYDSKLQAIASRCQDTLNYYLNTQKINVDDYFVGYDVTLALADGEIWARSITNPTLVAFYQGEQDYIKGKNMISYAYASSEITNTLLYFIDGDYYYRLNSPSVVETTTTVTSHGGESVTVTTYTHNGNPIIYFYGTIEECAALGALPAPGEF